MKEADSDSELEFIIDDKVLESVLHDEIEDSQENQPKPKSVDVIDLVKDDKTKPSLFSNRNNQQTSYNNILSDLYKPVFKPYARPTQ
jgi:hypothetical protein